MKFAKAKGAKGSHSSVNQKGQQLEEPLGKTRPHQVSMAAVKAAYERVKANKGAEGVDKETIQEFDKNLEGNLYKIWNRMSSGSYFPPPVRAVEIPKSDGKTRKLGIPTVSDRVAQTVAKMYLEPEIEPKFHADSYGFRPGRQQKDALTVTRKRCWEYDWVIDLDIKAFFDNLDHELLLDAVRQHTDCTWLLLYIGRWLKAPMQENNNEIVARDKGSPQGGVISPLLANIYLHHAFDEWMAKEFTYIPFERFADDIVVHCKTKLQAEFLLSKIRSQLQAWKLELHPDKTRIVYCKDSRRTGSHAQEEFDFLGFTFRKRTARSKKGILFESFAPAISKKAQKKLSDEIRKWEMQRRTDLSIKELAEMCNPQIRGWKYYGLFYRSKLLQVLNPINFKLLKWAKRKYRKNKQAAIRWLTGICQREPKLFAHWEMGLAMA